MLTIASPLDFRRAAYRRVPRFLFDYLDGGSGAEETLRRNVEDLAAVELRQRVLVGASEVRLETKLLGERCRMPIALGPVGIAGMYARRGECQAAAAAAQAGVPFCLSTVGLCGIEEVAAAVPAPIWFQLYVIRDRSFMRDLLAAARLAGCNTLVFTVDMPVPGVRYRDRRSGMAGHHAALRRILQALGKPGWAWNVGVRGRPHRLGNLTRKLGRDSGLDDYTGWLAANFDPAIRWCDLEWIRDLWDGPLVIKGILDVEDARAAVALGADGLVVSNHGGRQLDGAPSTARALPTIADAVGDRVTVFADGGVRTGADVARMLALGARGVLLGRAWVYALATAGEGGVTALLEMMRTELATTLALLGETDVAKLGAHNLARPITVAPALGAPAPASGARKKALDQA